MGLHIDASRHHVSTTWGVFTRGDTTIDRETLVSKYQARRDSTDFSAIGKRLNQLMNGKESAKAEQRWKMVTSPAASKDMRWIDKNISEVGKLMEKMKTLAKAAQDESLDDLTRMAMQIELGRNQHELNIVIDTMGYVYVENYKKGSEEYFKKEYGLYEDSSSYKMMIRALERIGSGEKWDIAEIGHIIMAGDDDRMTAVSEYHTVGVEWETTEDAFIPTVGEIIRGKGRSLMNAEDATISLAELEKQTKSLMKFQENFTSFIENNGENPVDPDRSLVMGLVGSLYALFDPFFKDASQVTMGHRKDTKGNNYDEMLEAYYERMQLKPPTPEEAARRKISLVNTKTPDEQLLEALKTQVQLSNRRLENIEKPSEVIPEVPPERPL